MSLRNVLLIGIVSVALSACGRWSEERYDVETAKRIDQQLPVGMSVREFRDAFPNASKIDANSWLVSVNDVCFFCYSGRGFVRSEQVFARVVVFDGDRLREVRPLPGVKP